MKTTINNRMEQLKKIALFYSLGIGFSFVIMAIIHLNGFLFESYFGYSHWRDIIKTAIISGAPFGVSIWAFLNYRFPTSLIDSKFIGQLLKPYFYYYLIGVLLALVLLGGIQLYIHFFDTQYTCPTSYRVFGFSLFLGILMSVGYYTIKKLNY